MRDHILGLFDNERYAEGVGLVSSKKEKLGIIKLNRLLTSW